MEDLQDYYYLGFYQKASVEGSKAGMPEDGQFMAFRSNLALGKIDFVINQTKKLDTPMGKGINLLANVMKLNSNEEIEKYYEEHMDPQIKATSSYYAVCCAICLLNCNKPGEALVAIADSKYPEASLIRIQALLGLNRTDLALEEYKNINTKSLSDIARAVIAIRTQEDITDALNNLLDQKDRYDGLSSPLLDSLVATCHFLNKEYEKVEDDLKNATEQFPSDINMTINNLALSFQQADAERVSNDITLIRSSKGQYSGTIEELDADFDEAAKEITL